MLNHWNIVINTGKIVKELKLTGKFINLFYIINVLKIYITQNK